MHFDVTFQKYNSCIAKHGRCHAESPSTLVKLLAKNGYHVIVYHEVPEDPTDIVHVEVGKGGPYEAEQSGQVC